MIAVPTLANGLIDLGTPMYLPTPQQLDDDTSWVGLATVPALALGKVDMGCVGCTAETGAQ